MKVLVFVLCVCVIAFGCDSEMKGPQPQPQTQAQHKILDWQKTISAQNLKIGDTIKFKGIAYNIIPYEYVPRSVGRNGVFKWEAYLRLDSITPVWTIPVYNPNQPIHDNPNVSIGAIVCTVYNPFYTEDLKPHRRELLDLYPSRVPLETEDEAKFWSRLEYRDGKEYLFFVKDISHHLEIEHRLEITGTIKGFERKILRYLSLRCINVEVLDISLMESKDKSNTDANSQ